MIAKWITTPPRYEKTTQYVFKKSFILEKQADSFNVRISGDTRYRFYLNGKELSHGPCKSTKFVQYYEEIECRDALVLGENKIEILLLHVSPQQGTVFTTAPHRDNPALYFDGTLSFGDKEEKIISDESFSVFKAKHLDFTWHNTLMTTLGPFEIVNGEEEYEEVECKVLYIPKPERGHYDSWGVKETYMLEKRPIQLLKLKEKKPVKLVREFYDENGNYNILLDAQFYTTAMVRYEYCAAKDTKINVIFSESMWTKKEDGTIYKDMRDNLEGVIEYGSWDNDHYDELITSGKPQVREPFWYRVFRFIRIECSQKPEYFNVYAARYNYDFEKDSINGGIGYFESSDERYSKMWDISRNTIECCAQETFMDCPYYEQQQYVGDGHFASMFAWSMFNDSKMQKKCLIDTVGSLQPDGMLASTSPNMWVQVLHGSIFYFIFLARSYLRFTGDTSFIKSMVGVIACNIEYFERWRTPEGLINPTDGARFIDWVDSWNRGLPPNGEKEPLTIYNVMYAAAIKDAAEICDACGYKGLSSDYRALHKKTIDAINKYCFDKERGLYVDVVGYKTYCEHTGVWAILSDAVTGEEARKLAINMMTGEDVAKSSFSKIFDLLRALDKVGLYEQYAPQLIDQWNYMLEKHCTTFCESTSFPRSECHAWSCTPVYEMTAKILGVTAIKNGYEKVRIKPTLMGLSYAKGRVPTGYGYIDISWKKDGNKFFIDISSSKEVEMEIILPSGKEINVTGKEYSAEE